MNQLCGSGERPVDVTQVTEKTITVSSESNRYAQEQLSILSTDCPDPEEETPCTPRDMIGVDDLDVDVDVDVAIGTDADGVICCNSDIPIRAAQRACFSIAK